MENFQQNGNKIPFPFFPIPECGETVFSLCCRVFERAGLNEKIIFETLTGQKRKTALIRDLPRYLPLFAQGMPEGHPWRNSEQIVINHTALPYYLYFDSQRNRGNWFTEYANTPYLQSLDLSLGLSQYKSLRTVGNLRFCPQCMEEQIESLGFSFYMREHQLPGTFICWKHGTILAHGCSNCGPYPIKGRGLSIPGKCACENYAPLEIESTKIRGDYENFLWLAEQNTLMVRSDGSACGNKIKETLRNVLVQKGFSRGKLLDYKAISSKIINRFGPDFCASLGYPVISNNGPSAWLRRLFGKEKLEEKRIAVIPFLIVIGAIFESIIDFESYLQKDFSAEGGSLENDDLQPLEDSRNDEDELLKEIVGMINSGTCSLRHISETLRIKDSQVASALKKNKIRLPLSVHMKKRIGEDKLEKIRKELRGGTNKNEIQAKYEISEWSQLLIELDQPGLSEMHKEIVFEKRRESHRDIIIELLKKNPDTTRTFIHDNFVGTYEHMMKYDQEWFYEMVVEKPIKNFEKERKEKYDRNEMDERKAEELKIFLEDLKSLDEKPVWITKTFCIKNICFRRFWGQESRFPLTKSILDENVETYEEFIKRKISWAIENYEKNEAISSNKLRRKAGVPLDILKKYKSHVINEAQKNGLGIHSSSYFYNG